MPRRAISLEVSAYKRLRAAKRPGESFTDVVNRLLDERKPSFSLFDGLLTQKESDELARVVQRFREEDLKLERTSS